MKKIIFRRIFKKLEAEQHRNKVSVILGPRQVGKTFALEYLHRVICSDGNSKGIFLDLDIYSNYERFISYENALNTFRLAGYDQDGEEPFYVFLDEFQRYADLSIIIKNIYDHHPKIKIFATGSSSLGIKDEIQESLAGRKIITYLFPLDFKEYLNFQGRDDLSVSISRINSLEGDNLFSVTGELYRYLESFLIWGGYPEVVLAKSDDEKREIITGIFDLFVKKELVEYLKIKKIYQTKKLIQYLAANNAQKIQYANISQFVGFSQKTVKHYIQLLKETFLIMEVRPHFTNKNKELTKIPKIYFLDPGVANFFINNFNALEFRKDASFLLETFILTELIKNGWLLDGVNYWQEKNANEVDFILKDRGKITAIEVKYKKYLKTRDFASLRLFKKYYPGSVAFLVNLGSQRFHNGTRLILPYAVAEEVGGGIPGSTVPQV